MTTFGTFLVAVVALAFAPSVVAQDPPNPRAKWDQLDPEQRALVRQRFEMWKHLPSDRRDELERRQAELENARTEALGPMPRPPHPVGDPEADRRLRELLKKKSDEILGRSGLSGEQIENLKTSDLPALARARALDRLHDFETRGVVTAEEAARLRELKPPALAKALRRVQKDAFLKSPPPPYLAIPQAERSTLEQLPPDEFLREVKKYLPRPPKGGPPPFFGQDGVPQGGPPRPPRPPQNPRFLSVKRWIDSHVSDAERDEIQRAGPLEKRQTVRKILKAHARAALRERGADERLVNETDVLPRDERDVRLIQLIDRDFAPPPPR